MIFVKSAYAQCPVCIVTVGGGLILAKKLGIDDLLVSLWISALNTALSFWLAPQVKAKIFNNPVLWSVGLYFISIIYLWWSKQIGHVRNTFVGVDKILFGLTVGLVISLVAILIDRLIRKKNHGKVLFYYQKVIIPVVLLVIVTIIFKSFI